MKYLLAQFFFRISVKHDDLLMAFISKLLIDFLLFCLAVGLNPAHIQCCFLQSVWHGVFPSRLGVCCHYFFYHTIKFKFLCRHIFYFLCSHIYYKNEMLWKRGLVKHRCLYAPITSWANRTHWARRQFIFPIFAYLFNLISTQHFLNHIYFGAMIACNLLLSLLATHFAGDSKPFSYFIFAKWFLMPKAVQSFTIETMLMNFWRFLLVAKI